MYSLVPTSVRTIMGRVQNARNRGRTKCHFSVDRDRVRGQFGWLDRRSQTGCSETKIANFMSPINASMNMAAVMTRLYSPLYHLC